MHSPSATRSVCRTRQGKLLLAVTADAEVEVPLHLQLPQPQLAGIAAQPVVGREHIRGVQRIERRLPATEVGGQQAVRVVLGAAPQPAHLAIPGDLVGQPEPGPDAGQEGMSAAISTSISSAMAPSSPNLWCQRVSTFGSSPTKKPWRTVTSPLRRVRLQAEAAMTQIVQSGLLPAGNPGIGIRVIRLAGANVIVERRPVEVIADRLPQLFASPLAPAQDAAAGLVQPPLAVRCHGTPLIGRFLQVRGGLGTRQGQGRRQYKLLACHLVARLGPGVAAGCTMASSNQAREPAVKAGSRSSRVSVTLAWGARSSRHSPRLNATPSSHSRHRKTSLSVGRNRYSLWIATVSGCRSISVSANGCWARLASNRGGMGVRSGNSRPLQQNWRSFGASPKSPP